MKMPEASRIEQGFGQEPLYLYTHAQVAEALARQEAVMRMALDALLTVANPKAPAAIKVLEEQLK